MISSLSKSRLNPVWMACVLLAGTVTMRAGDKIQFSSPSSGKKEQPSRLSKPIEAEKSRLFEGGFNNPTPQMMAPPPMVIVPDKKKQEEVDQQRNWLLVRPEDRNKSLSMEQVYKIKEYEVDGREKQTGSVVARYLQGTTSPDTRRRPSDLSSTKEEEEAGRSPGSKSPFDSNRSLSGPDLNNRDGRGDLDSSGRMNGGGGRREFDAPVRSSRFEAMMQDRHRERLNDYKQMFEPVGTSMVPARGFFDPMNSMVDTTRQPVNPVTPVHADTFDRSRSLNNTDPFNPNNVTQSPRVPTMESPYERAFGRKTSTDFLPQADPNKAKYKPAILPFPKRVM